MIAEEVEVLAVDVEGYDAQVVLESFKVQGFELDLVIFEWKIAIQLFKNKFNEVMETLHRRVYITNCKRPESGDWACHGG